MIYQYDNHLMNSDLRRIIVVALIAILVTFGAIIYFENRFGDAKIVSQIDSISYHIDDQTADAVNISVLFGITITNYGQVRDVTIPCSTIQSYLEVNQSSVPLVPLNSSTFQPDTSYILNTTYTQPTCSGGPIVETVGEDVVNQIAVVVPFHLVSGTYNFIWQHSYAEFYEGATITVNLNNTQSPITTLLDNPASD